MGILTVVLFTSIIAVLAVGTLLLGEAISDMAHTSRIARAQARRLPSMDRMSAVQKARQAGAAMRREMDVVGIAPRAMDAEIGNRLAGFWTDGERTAFFQGISGVNFTSHPLPADSSSLSPLTLTSSHRKRDAHLN